MNRSLASLFATCAITLGSLAQPEGPPTWAGSEWQPGAAGWINLLEAPGDWFRESPSTAKFPLIEASPWRFETDTGVLHCAATGVYEMLYNKRTLGDGVLHVEWRYTPAEGTEAKNDSGIMFRVSPDRKLKLQVQLAGRGLGRIAGDQQRGDARVHIGVGDRHPEIAAAIGGWNALELDVRGQNVRLVINGVETASIGDLDSPPGQIGLQAEYWPVEFRNVFFKAR